MEKFSELVNYIKDLKRVVLAFSGGVDSTFLLAACKEALGEDAVAVTIMSPYIPRWEIKEAQELSSKLNINHQILEVEEIPEAVRLNPKDRCYLCKTAVFTMIKEYAKKNGYDYVIDGTNFDDTKEYRPGLRALAELGVKSPLKELGITKKEIRAMSKEIGLPTFDKPPYACLLTRLPYDEEIKLESLPMIEQAERALMDLGYKWIRVRKHGDIARIEMAKEEMIKALEVDKLKVIGSRLREIGFKHVTLDVEGYMVGGGLQ